MLKSFILICIILSVFSCDTLSPQDDTEIIREDDKIYIVDNTSKKWDVTHASNVYGLHPNNFQYGLGPFAIEPINNPVMLSKGENGYPSSNNTSTVIGANFYNSVRAYPLNVLSRHEIVNEIFSDNHVAVAY